MPSFLIPGFALAALGLALGPTIIHLLNRRRFRLVEWAAMDFLREALQRNRRIMQLRDLLLLLLRTAAIALFALALSRPYFTSSSDVVDPDQPVHAVLAIDNSLSMAYTLQQGTLLEEAKNRAIRFIDELPDGSRISVLAICGPKELNSPDAYETKQDAREAIEKIAVVDRSANVSVAIELVKRACDLGPKMPKRVVLLGDQQASFWNIGSLPAELDGVPELQVVSVAPSETENIWISDFRVQDKIADTDLPTTFLVTVKHEGSHPHENVQVVLSVGSKKAVAEKNISLQPGQTRLISFRHQIRGESLQRGEVKFVSAVAAVRIAAGDGSDAEASEDRLARDNARYLSIPVVSALPVVFVDQWGSEEDPQRERYGETRSLRRCLASGFGARGGRQLIEVRHVQIEELDREILQDARLVVMAGVESPLSVDLLREYVIQGGQLFLAAGAGFKPDEWNKFAWSEGQGILPMPLAREPFGKLQSEIRSKQETFQLSFESMRGGEQFMLPGESEDKLRDFYEEAYFFQAVVAEMSDEDMQRLQQRDVQAIEKNRQFVRQAAARKKSWTQDGNGQIPEKHQGELANDEQRRARIEPSWLTWADRVKIDEDQRSPEQLARASQPRVLARYTNGLPFLIERSLGRGHVMMTTSGVFSPWNTLRHAQTIVMFDRILRLMIHRTVESGGNLRNFASGTERENLRISTLFRKSRITLAAPGEAEQVLSVAATPTGGYQVRLPNMNDRGIYHLRAYGATAASSDGRGEGRKEWDVPLAVNGPSDESKLAAISPAEFKQRFAGNAKIRWVGRGEEISQAGAQVWGTWMGVDLWKWLIALAGLCLLVEMAILAWPAMAKGRAG